MPKYYIAYERRHQREMLGRKGALEASMLFEPIEPTPTKEAPQSPVSVLTNVTNDYPLELKPLTLPGAWTVVGKKGRPAKVESKMYEEVKAKKKKRKRKAKTGGDELADPSDELAAVADMAASLLAALGERPSTSSSVDRSARTVERHAKAATRGRSAKAWASYRLAKEEKIVERDALIAALAADGMLEEEDGEMPQMSSSKLKPAQSVPRKTYRNSHAMKTRRARRFEAASERCFSPSEAGAEPGAGETICITKIKPQKEPSDGVTAPMPETPSKQASEAEGSEAMTTKAEPGNEAMTTKKGNEKKANCSIM